jgi:hypothetical protein
VHLKNLRIPGLLAWGLASFVWWLALSAAAFGQSSLEYGGFFQESAQLFARKPNPSDVHVQGAAQFEIWCRTKINNRYSWHGSFDLQLDTHRDVDRNRWFDLSERGFTRPAGALSEFYFDAKLGHLDLRIGKQRIRWGRADGFNPTDNVIPYDYLDLFSETRLPSAAIKADLYLAQSSFEFIWTPFYTPTRLPLIGQRWFPRIPDDMPDNSSNPVPVAYQDTGGALPSRTIGNSQWGVRYNQILPGAEFSLSYLDGFDDIPFFRPKMPLLQPNLPVPDILVSFSREYYRSRIVGLDFASEIGPFGVRGEAAYYDRTDPGNLDHLLFVIGLDKTWGDWSAIVQYAGQKLNGRIPGQATFPELGLGSALIYRLERTLGPSRSFQIKGAVRLTDGDFLVQPVYSVAITNGWRLKLGASIFAGPQNGYLGQFRDSSHITVQLIYAF